MATTITPEQMIALENHPRHKEICKQWIRDITTYLRGLNSGDETWAKKRIVAASIAHHPNSQDYNEWVAQMTSSQKGAAIWNGADGLITPANLDLTVDFLNNNGGAKYDEMANIVFTLRASRIEF